MSTIFISYASQDRETARALAGFLEAQGHSVWWDRTIPPGRVFDDVIQEALAAARCVVVLWSSHSVRSNWVKVEADEAAARGLLVPVLVEAITPPIQFKRIQAANLSDWRGDKSDPELRTLLAAIERLLGRPPAAAASQPVARPAPAGLSHTVRTVAWSVGTTLALVTAVWLFSRTGTEDTTAGRAARNAQQPTGADTRADPTPADPGSSVSSTSDDRQTSGSTNAPAAQRGELLNLLSPQNGGELITAEDALWASSVDGDESTNLWVNASATSEAVFGFKDGRAATIEAVEILVGGTSPNNVSELEVLTGNEPDGRFERLQVFTPKNILIVKERYQRFVFPPRTARYIKARVLKAHGGFSKVLAEWRVLGRLP